MDSYLTVKAPTRTTISIKKSKFIASTRSVEDEKDAKTFIKDIREEFHDATHNTYVYKIEEVFNSSDDGEPLNTAGKPILSVIENKNLHHVVIVVTRYFGGTELGIGGLIRAYREAAEKVITAAGTTKKYCKEEISFSVPYEFFGGVSDTLEKYNCTIVEEKMGDSAFFKVSVKKEEKKAFVADLLKHTKGNATVDL